MGLRPEGFRPERMAEAAKQKKKAPEQSREQEKVPEVLQRVIEVANKVHEATLQQSTPEAAAELKKRKEQARELINEVLSQVTDYTNAIAGLERTAARMAYATDLVKARRHTENADKRRTRAHNSLMSKIASATRYIQFNFGEISETALGDWEDDQEEKGEMLLEVNRVKFPQPLFSSHTNRYEVTDWAVRLNAAMTTHKIEV